MNTRNKSLIITGIIVLVCALVAFLTGGWIAGWDFIAFFKSSTFMWIMILVGIYALVVAVILVRDWLKNKL